MKNISNFFQDENFWMLLSFLFLFILFYKRLKKFILSFLTNKVIQVNKEIDEIEASIVELEATQTSLEKKLSDINKHISQIKEESDKRTQFLLKQEKDKLSDSIIKKNSELQLNIKKILDEKSKTIIDSIFATTEASANKQLVIDNDVKAIDSSTPHMN